MNESNIFLLCANDTFSKYINVCLKCDSLKASMGETLPLSYDPEVVIVNLYQFNENIEKQIDDILDSGIKKIILLENALDMYLNSENIAPFSVYTEMVAKNEICKRFLDVERKIINSSKQYVIFRVSEIYGTSIDKNIIEDMFTNKELEIENSLRDFIFDGDVISAIETALRKEVSGIFDIASGNSVELKKIFNIISNITKIDYNIHWKRKKLEITFNCENFKFYKWEPLISLETGLKTLFNFRKRHEKNKRHC